MLTNLRRRDDGYTLIEVMVVLAITAIIGGMVGSSFISTSRATAAADARVAALNDLRPAMERLTREVRAASPLVVASTGAYSTQLGTEFTRDGVRWRLDYYLDMDTNVLYVDYARFDATGTLVTESTRNLVSEVSNDADTPVFTYHDNYGGQITCIDLDMTDTDDIATCRDRHLTAARVTIRVTRDVGDHAPIRFETSIAIRNTKLG